MSMGDIRSRMLLAALLPVTLVVLLLTGLFFFSHVGKMNDADDQRARSLVRQLAAASEYSLFSANLGHLQSIANGVLREPDVRSVAILDSYGRLLASAGNPSYSVLPVPSGMERETVDPVRRVALMEQPITANQLRGHDLWQVRAPFTGTSPHWLGSMMVEFSGEPAVVRDREMLTVSLVVVLGGLAFGGLLAVRLGRGVVEPVLRVSNMVQRLGDGDLSVRGALLPGDPLRRLQLGLNQMAQRLESNRSEMEQRIAEATLELRAKKEEAEAATRAKSRFLSAASHDLRQPTHALGMFVARLAQLPHDAQSRHLIGSLEASVRAMQDMLDALLDVSRLDADAVQVCRQPFALSEVFAQLQGELALTAAEKGLRLRLRPTSVWLMSDPALIHRILLNLAVNALRYTTQGTVLIACRVCADGKHVRIEVRDSGIGIAPEHHEAIFKEFFQIGNTARDRRKGFGLGLNIVQRKAQLLGHRLRFDSGLGAGTRVSIEVPLACPSDAATVIYPSVVTVPDDLGGLVVLVVEDDALAREGIATLLESWGCEVRVADGLAEALMRLREPRLPDVIVSDYRLPGDHNGIEIIGQLRSAGGRSIAACLMSGDTDPMLMQSVKDAGLTLLHKPVRPAKLRSLIRHLTMNNQTTGVALV